MTDLVLRDYQQQAVDEAIAGLRSQDRGQLIMACGTGKTEVALSIARLLESERSAAEDAPRVTVVLVPSLALAQQWFLRIARYLPDAQVLGLCSDEELRAENDFTAPTTTHQRELAEFISGPGHRIVLGTYHSSRILGRVSQRRELDLVICDEAHRTAGARDAAFSTVLHDARMRVKKRLFLTATPRTREVIHQNERRELVSMDDGALYGDRLFQYRFRQAIEDGWLTDYELVLSIVTDADVHRAIEQSQGLLVGEEGFNARALASAIVAQRAVDEYGVHSVIVFANRINSSRQFSMNIGRVANLSGQSVRRFHLDGASPQAAREAAISALRDPSGDPVFVSNVRVLGEGVDAPAVDAVMFIEPKGSQIDVVQAVGRALRPSPGKKVSRIIIPVYLAPGESAEAVLASSEFAHVWQVVDALRDHDESLDAALDRIRRNEHDPESPRYAPQVLPEQIRIEGSFNFARFRDAVTVKVLDKITSEWQTGLDEYVAWREAHKSDALEENQQIGQLLPSDHVTASGFPLGKWAKAQRTALTRGTLGDDRFQRLSQEEFWFSERVNQSIAAAGHALWWQSILGRKADAFHAFAADEGLRSWMMTLVLHLNASKKLVPTEVAALALMSNSHALLDAYCALMRLFNGTMHNVQNKPWTDADIASFIAGTANVRFFGAPGAEARNGWWVPTESVSFSLNLAMSNIHHLQRSLPEAVKERLYRCGLRLREPVKPVDVAALHPSEELLAEGEAAPEKEEMAKIRHEAKAAANESNFVDVDLDVMGDLISQQLGHKNRKKRKAQAGNVELRQRSQDNFERRTSRHSGASDLADVELLAALNDWLNLASADLGVPRANALLTELVRSATGDHSLVAVDGGQVYAVGDGEPVMRSRLVNYMEAVVIHMGDFGLQAITNAVFSIGLAERVPWSVVKPEERPEAESIEGTELVRIGDGRLLCLDESAWAMLLRQVAGDAYSDVCQIGNMLTVPVVPPEAQRKLGSMVAILPMEDADDVEDEDKARAIREMTAMTAKLPQSIRDHELVAKIKRRRKITGHLHMREALRAVAPRFTELLLERTQYRWANTVRGLERKIAETGETKNVFSMDIVDDDLLHAYWEERSAAMARREPIDL